jgi:hypothetical protein
VTATGRIRSEQGGESATVQSTRPRDLGALVLVIGLFAAMLVVTAVLGSPATR